jgi:hypothetical protein
MLHDIWAHMYIHHIGITIITILFFFLHIFHSSWQVGWPRPISLDTNSNNSSTCFFAYSRNVWNTFSHTNIVQLCHQPFLTSLATYQTFFTSLARHQPFLTSPARYQQSLTSPAKYQLSLTSLVRYQSSSPPCPGISCPSALWPGISPPSPLWPGISPPSPLWSGISPLDIYGSPRPLLHGTVMTFCWNICMFWTMQSQDCDVVLVRRTIDLGEPRGVGKLEWGGNGEREVS